MDLSPIVIFTYNRPWHTQQTVEALLKNEYASESDLIIFSDAPKNEAAREGVEKTRSYIKSITGFKSLRVIIRDRNYGLADNIIDGVTTIVNEFGRIIVLEDDLLTSPYFLKFMNEALNLYENEERVISIQGYIFPLLGVLPETFFIRGADCLGWGTWKRGWDIFDSNGEGLLLKLEERKQTKEFDFRGAYPYTKMLRKQALGKIGSWAIRWYASAFLNEKLALYPCKSLVLHNGSDGSGTNCGESLEFETELSKNPIKVFPVEIMEIKSIRNKMVFYYRFYRRWLMIKSLFYSRAKFFNI